MRQSQQVLEWQQEARVEGRVEGLLQGRTEGQVNDILRLLELRFPPGPTAELIAAIHSVTDPGNRARIFDAAVTAASLEAFQKQTLPWTTPPPPATSVGSQNGV